MQYVTRDLWNVSYGTSSCEPGVVTLRVFRFESGLGAPSTDCPACNGLKFRTDEEATKVALAHNHLKVFVPGARLVALRKANESARARLAQA